MNVMKTPQNLFLDALASDIVAGTGNLASWLKHVEQRQAVDTLFELEMWLRALEAFFHLENLPLDRAERDNLVRRSFEGEFRAVAQALEIAEMRAVEVLHCGQPGQVEFERAAEAQLRRETVLDYSVTRMLEQLTPADSLLLLIDGLSDLHVTIDAFSITNYTCRTYWTTGRSFRRSLRSCRYVDMLLGQRFRLQYDRVDDPGLASVLRRIPGDGLRRNVALGLLYLLRQLRYLKSIETHLRQDLPLRRVLPVFALVQRDGEVISEFLRSRLIKAQGAVSGASELVAHSLKAANARTAAALAGLARERAPSAMRRGVEQAHNLWRSCFESAVVTLAQAFDDRFDSAELFPGMHDGAGVRLRRDLWAFRRDLKALLDSGADIELEIVMERVAAFRESWLRDLSYGDWERFERCSDAVFGSAGQGEMRAAVRNLVALLEAFVGEAMERGTSNLAAAIPDEQ